MSNLPMKNNLLKSTLFLAFIFTNSAILASESNSLYLKNEDPLRFTLRPKQSIQLIYLGKNPLNKYLLCTVGSKRSSIIEIKNRNKKIKLNVVYEKSYNDNGQNAFYRIIPRNPNNLRWEAKNILENDKFLTFKNQDNKHSIYGFCLILSTKDASPAKTIMGALNDMAKKINMPVR